MRRQVRKSSFRYVPGECTLCARRILWRARNPRVWFQHNLFVAGLCSDCENNRHSDWLRIHDELLEQGRMVQG